MTGGEDVSGVAPPWHGAPMVLLLTGPAGAGKTAVADAWARRQAVPILHLSLDDLRDRVKAGYANPEDGITPEMLHQLALARAGCAQLAKLYVGAGFGCIIDDAIFPAWPAAGYEPWVEALHPLRPLLVVLLPALETVVGRNASRVGHRRLREETLRIIYEQMAPWRRAGVPVIDNTALSVEQTAAQLQALVTAGIADVAPPAS